MSDYEDRYEDENGPSGPTVADLTAVWDGIAAAMATGRPITIRHDGSVLYRGQIYGGSFIARGPRQVLVSAMSDVAGRWGAA